MQLLDTQKVGEHAELVEGSGGKEHERLSSATISTIPVLKMCVNTEHSKCRGKCVVMLTGKEMFFRQKVEVRTTSSQNRRPLVYSGAF